MVVPLKPLNPDSSLSPAKLQQIGRVPTEILLHSPLPGQKDSLKTPPDGTILDDHALLYDQAFALLGLAAAAAALDARGEFEARALELRGLIEHRLGTPDGSLRSEETADALRGFFA